jgi:hypothetical protein
MRRLNPSNGSIIQFSEALSYIIGLIVIAAALGAVLLSGDASMVVNWLLKHLGVGFILLLTALVFTAFFSLIRIKTSSVDHDHRQFWYLVGMQAANGVTTLALTFTLLGISLGIGGLAEQNLTPETVQGVIRDLTANFSLAFMTTVVGLPLSAVLRAMLTISHNKPNTI